MNFKEIGLFVSLSQGLAINKASEHLISNTKHDKFILPLLRIADMIENKFEKFISTDVNKNVIASPEDLIYTRTGQIGLAFKGYNGVVHNNSFIVKLKSNEIEKDYLFAILQSPFFRKQALAQARNSVQPDLTHSMFNSIKIPIPSTYQQKLIAKIYSFLSKKIDNNKQINTQLEELAKTIYDYWFLQFEFPNEEGKPYKSSGGKMVYNEQLKKEIPEGWSVKSLDNILSKQNRTFNYQKNINTIDLSVMPTNKISLNELNESKAFNTNLFSMKKYDILFGSIRPYLKKAGIAPCDGAVAGTVHCYIVNKEFDYNFALITLCSNNMFAYAINNSKGTKMPVVSSDDLLKYLVPYNEDVVKLFNSINIREIICNNIMQNQELASMRDFLLPLLMNGQVTFKDENGELENIDLENEVKKCVSINNFEGFNQWKQIIGYAARGEADDEILKKIYDAMDDNDKK